MGMYLGTQKVTPVVTVPSYEEAPIEDAVRFFDYDGTILYTYTAAEFLALTEMPANPSHTGLVAQGWNWTLSDAKDHVEDWECLDIGQMYTTSSGDTEIDIVLYQGRLAPYLGLSINGTINIDWGDNSTPDTVTGTSWTSQKRTLHTYSTPGNYTITISITNGGYAFYESSTYPVLSGDFNNSTRNDVYANAIKAVRIGDGDIRIKQYAFSACRSLQYITLPASVSAASSNYAFYYCVNLKSIILPSNNIGMEISSYMFSYCYNLEYISIPYTVNIIGNSFYSCYSLESLIIPKSHTNPTILVDSSTLARLERWILPEKKLKVINEKNYDITDTLSTTTIKAYQYSNIDQLKTAIIPDSIQLIQTGAFRDCRSLKSVHLPSSNFNIDSSSPNTIFYSCYALHTIENLDTITYIGSSLFSNCYSLSGPLSFASDADFTSASSIFSSCWSLLAVTLPSTLETIPAGAFNQCRALTTINIPSTVTSIGSTAFPSCNCLSSITIPSGVTTIGNYAFQNCYGLGEIHVQATEPPTLGGSGVFSNLPSDCIIYVPSASLSAYQSATNWSTYASQMVGE